QLHVLPLHARKLRGEDEVVGVLLHVHGGHPVAAVGRRGKAALVEHLSQAVREGVQLPPGVPIRPARDGHGFLLCYVCLKWTVHRRRPDAGAASADLSQVQSACHFPALARTCQDERRERVTATAVCRSGIPPCHLCTPGRTERPARRGLYWSVACPE